jgi:hypothetical protein
MARVLDIGRMVTRSGGAVHGAHPGSKIGENPETTPMAARLPQSGSGPSVGV